MEEPLDLPLYEIIGRAMAHQAAGPHKITAAEAWARTPEFEKIGYLDMGRALLRELRENQRRES